MAATAILSMLSLSPCQTIGVVDSVFDIGTVEETAQSIDTVSFRIPNISNKTVAITSVVSGCACSVASYPSSIPPGDTGIIRVIVYHGNRKVSFEKVLVLTNAKNRQKIQLLIKRAVRNRILTPQTPIEMDGITHIPIRCKNIAFNINNVRFGLKRADGTYYDTLNGSYSLTQINDTSFLTAVRITLQKPNVTPGTECDIVISTSFRRIVLDAVIW
jgi:hypothetical protein